MTETLFDQVVFSGGGTRCMWQGGFMHVLEQHVPVHPARIAGVSGGACSACGFMTHRGIRVRDSFIAHFAEHDRNIPLHEPFDGEPGRSPHQLIYRDIIEKCFGDEEARRTIAEGAELHVLLARPPDHDWKRLTGAAMTLVYAADTAIRSTPHLEWAQRMGLTEEFVDANQAARDGHLTDSDLRGGDDPAGLRSAGLGRQAGDRRRHGRPGADAREGRGTHPHPADEDIPQPAGRAGTDLRATVGGGARRQDRLHGPGQAQAHLGSAERRMPAVSWRTSTISKRTENRRRTAWDV